MTTIEERIAADPDWLRPRRRRGFERFAELDLPSEREEIWRYVELDFSFAEFEPASGPGEPRAEDEVAGALAPPATLRVLDGFPGGGWGSADGVTLSSFGAAPVEGLRRVVEHAGIEPDDIFAAAHDAFGGEGAFVAIDPGATIAKPIYLDIQTTRAGLATFPAVAIHAQTGSEAVVVVHYRSAPEELSLVVPRVMALAGPGARLAVVVLQEWGNDTRAVGQARIVAERDATVRFGEVGVGGRFARLHLLTELVGQGSEAEIVGAYFGDGHQTLDYRYFMRHAAVRTRSDMFLKGAVEDEARSVFTGLIRIEEDAQKTEAFQTNRNLILSKGASAQSVPNLEILANDVRCGHGSTVGPLDAEERYYLMSRGLARPRADRLQVRGFFEEALRRLPAPSLVSLVSERLNAKFIAAQEAGRV